MLIDDLGGTLHRALGGLPNMVYVIAQDRTIRFNLQLMEAIRHVSSPVPTTAATVAPAFDFIGARYLRLPFDRDSVTAQR